MATHATMRHDYVEARLMVWLTALSITGTPAVQHARVPRQATATPAPWVRVAFRPLDPTHRGRITATQSALGMAVLVVCDLFYPDGEDGATFNLYSPQQAAADLQAQLQFLTLSFLDYTIPAAPVTFADTALRITRPVTVRYLDPSDGFRRQQVRATVEWTGRVDDSFA